MDKYLIDWINKAEEDLIVINRLTDEGIYAPSSVCFHCQQLAEKYLKIFLIYNQREVAKTHNIEFLLELCNEIDKDFFDIDPKNLSDFGVQARYPGETFVPTDKEVIEYKQLAISIRNLVRDKIKPGSD